MWLNGNGGEHTHTFPPVVHVHFVACSVAIGHGRPLLRRKSLPVAQRESHTPSAKPNCSVMQKDFFSLSVLCGKETSNNKRQNRQLSSLYNLIISGFPYVGATGFEPTTPCSQSRCANRTALRPVLFRDNVLSQKRCKGITFFYTNQTFC